MTESMQPGDPFSSQSDNRQRPENRSQNIGNPDNLDDIVRRIRKTPQPLASLGQRLGGALVDLLIGILTVLPGVAFAVFSNAFLQGGGDFDVLLNCAKALGACLVTFVFVLVFFYQMNLLSVYGQTIGKRVVGTRIVKVIDQGNPGFAGAFLLRFCLPIIIFAIPAVGFFFCLIDILVIFGQDRRCIHDMIAGTIVIEAEPR